MHDPAKACPREGGDGNRFCGKDHAQTTTAKPRGSARRAICGLRQTEWMPASMRGHDEDEAGEGLQHFGRSVAAHAPSPRHEEPGPNRLATWQGDCRQANRPRASLRSPGATKQVRPGEGVGVGDFVTPADRQGEPGSHEARSERDPGSRLSGRDRQALRAFRGDEGAEARKGIGVGRNVTPGE